MTAYQKTRCYLAAALIMLFLALLEVKPAKGFPPQVVVLPDGTHVEAEDIIWMHAASGRQQVWIIEGPLLDDDFEDAQP
jgi:hypothetical protein